MVIMVLVGIIRNAHWEKFGRHETIRAKCFYNVNRFEFSCSFETVFGDVFCTWFTWLSFSWKAAGGPTNKIPSRNTEITIDTDTSWECGSGKSQGYNLPISRPGPREKSKAKGITHLTVTLWLEHGTSECLTLTYWVLDYVTPHGFYVAYI